VRRLNAAGISCGVLIAPVVPGLSDDDEHLEAIARACKDAGAASVHTIALHLRPKVREHYLGFLAKRRPDLVSLYRRRFPTGSYQPATVQRRIEATVSRAFGGAPRRSGYESGPTKVALPRHDDVMQLQFFAAATPACPFVGTTTDANARTSDRANSGGRAASEF
jgi:hypothetical protein